MPATNPELTLSSKLRRDAEARLKQGSAPASAGWSVGPNALSLLYELASKPPSAPDAAKLLHELQVHQVELDLQHEQRLTTERELIEALKRYEALYEHAPVAYLNLSAQYDILESNVAAASLLAVAQDELRGRNIDKFLLPASRPTLHRLLKRLRPGGARESCSVQIRTAAGSCKLRLLASATPGGHSFLVVLDDLRERS